jgi:hypothetical protein
MQPLYFLPHCNKAKLAPDGKLNREILEARGISDVFSDVVGPDAKDCSVGDVSGGPGGLSGVILTYRNAAGVTPPAFFKPDRQEWHQCDEGADVWIGLVGMPKADDMARNRRYGGYHVVLSDDVDDSWAVPVIRRPDDSTNLPTSARFGKDGEFTETIKERYRSFWDETAKVQKWLLLENGLQDHNFSVGEAVRLALRALSINYRVGRHEQNVLGMIDNINYLDVLSITIDLAAVNAASQAEIDAKKKAEHHDPLSIPSITPGQQDDSQDTAQVAENSTC